MRTTYRVLALLIAVGVVVQAATIAYAMFQVQHAADAGQVYDKSTVENVGQQLHGAVGGMVLPAIALALLILSFFAKIPGGVKWAAITFGVAVLQIAFAEVAKGAPIVGVLHGLNAFALAGVASLAARQARTAPAVRDAPVTAN